MAIKRWNLSVHVSVIKAAQRNADEDGLTQSDYVALLVRKDTLERRLNQADLDDTTREVLHRELEAIL